MLPVCFALALGLLSAILLPLAVRLHLVADGSLVGVRVDGALWRGLLGLTVCQDAGIWVLRPLVWRWPVRWPAWKLTFRSTAPAAGDRRPGAGTAPLARPARPAAGRRGPAALRWRLWRPLGRLLTGVPHAFGIHRGAVRGQLGLADPALTGLVYGCHLVLASAGGKRFCVDLTPSFIHTGFRGSAELTGHVYLSRLLWAAARAGLGVAWQLHRRAGSTR